jgi:hypothetical protein
MPPGAGSLLDASQPPPALSKGDMQKAKLPNLYGRKPSAVVNGSRAVVETFASRRQALRARPALARRLGQPIV